MHSTVLSAGLWVGSLRAQFWKPGDLVKLLTGNAVPLHRASARLRRCSASAT